VLTFAFLRARPARRLAGLASRTLDAAFALLDRTKGMTQSPERAARRLSLGVLSRAMPGPMRNALWLVRGVAGIGMRQR
jgi:HAMP domain-containing protein